jgi:hypothetical protein
LEYDRTILPPKKYFLPPRETLFRYRPGAGFEPCTDALDQRIILFGVHACDIFAFNILDRVFAGKYDDPYYQTRRKNVAIIGIDCTPDNPVRNSCGHTGNGATLESSKAPQPGQGICNSWRNLYCGRHRSSFALSFSTLS